MNEKDFLLKLAEAYQKFDASIIAPYLADDMHYASMWVFHEMTSKQEYMDYLVGKLEAMKRNQICMEFQIVPGRMHKQALLVANQQSSDENCGFVVDFNPEGKVCMINMTAQAFF